MATQIDGKIHANNPRLSEKKSQKVAITLW